MRFWARAAATLRPVARAIYTGVVGSKLFPGSQTYWEERYRRGEGSGAGSAGKLARFKAQTLNALVESRSIQTVIEYGCGDGCQLTLAQYPRYTGFDVSPEAIRICKQKFAKEPSKSFKLVAEYAGETAELTLSLDVIYHLVEDNVYHEYMERLFDTSTALVAIYSSNTDVQARHQPPHVRHRMFSSWALEHRPQWKLLRHIPNPYPLGASKPDGSFADFYIWERG